MTGSASRELELKLDGGCPALGPQRIAATLTVPGDNSNGTMLVCLPGGGYSRFYYQAEFDGFEGYSFAEYMTAKGYTVLTLDHLGMGDSARPDSVELVDKTCIAAFNHAAVQSILSEFETRPQLVGIGHSMGGMALIEQQATHATFDKICVLGWTNIGLSIDTSELDLKPELHQYAPTDRAQMRPLFFLPDVPDELIKQDEAYSSLTPSPFAQQAVQPGIVAAEAAAITCPVFLSYGDVDISPAPANEPGFYQSAKSVDPMILTGSAHNHNYATTRAKLWDNIAAFATAND
ncbi:MAG: alpha/beta hydrolase [Hyphomonadaceae bacterium]|nr:alpha/beta hydrolase [Hyphomonadaceae bacterium]